MQKSVKMSLKGKTYRNIYDSEKKMTTGFICLRTGAIYLYIEDLTRVVILYEVYQTSLRHV